MKLFEAIDLQTLRNAAKRGSKKDDALMKVKFLKQKAKKANPKNPPQDKLNVRGTTDSFAGYLSRGFGQNAWK